MRQPNKATENGTTQGKGTWASHLFCAAAPEEQKPEGNSSFDLPKQHITKSELINENYV